MQKEDIDKYLEKTALELRLKGCSQRTVDSYCFFIRQFLESIDDPKTVDLEKVKLYRVSLMDNYKIKSQSLAISSLRFFFDKVMNRPEISTKLELPKKEETLPEVLTQEEIKALINSASSQKTKLIIKMLYASGLRVSELVNLKPSDMNFAESTGWVRKGKGKKDRLFKITESLSKQLQKWLSKNPNNKFIFSEEQPMTARNVHLLIKRAAKKAGITKNVHPHTLRHSFATHLLENGENLLVIQQLLGHKNLETTKVYIHISQDQLKKVKSPLDRL